MVGIFETVASNWRLFILFALVPALLAELDRIVYCAVLVYAFWNLPKRLAAQEQDEDTDEHASYSWTLESTANAPDKQPGSVDGEAK